jgi:Dolichyl-phosphate-mannose-protein mannosyltransferase
MGRARWSGGVVVAIVLVSAGLRAWAAWEVPVPWFAGDEVIYAQLGQALWHHGELRILGAPTAFFSLVYPALAGLPLSLWDVDTGYRILRVIQPLVMSLAAVPAYLWARSLGVGRWALAAAALTVAIPALGYSAFVMTEVAFYPVAALAAWALAAAVERPTLGRQTLLLGAVALATLTRLQAIVLVPAFVTAVVLDAALARRPRRVLLHWRVLVGFAVLGLAWIIWRAASGGAFSGLLGGYGQVAQTGYDAGAVGRFVIYHVGASLLLVGVAPACAVASLLVDAARGRESDDGVRAFLAVASSLALWLVLQVGVFASENGGRLEERYLIVLAPVFFVGLAVWLARDGPRPVFRTAWIALLAVGFVALLPLRTLIAPDALGDSFTNLALWRELAPNEYSTAVTVAACAMVALWALLPRRLLVALPLALLAAFTFASVSSSREAILQARLQQARLLGLAPGWIDRAADGPVTFLYDGDPYWTAVWENLFFNHRLTRVIDLPAAHVPGPLPQRVVGSVADGRMPGLKRYVVSWDSFAFDGQEIARAPLQDVTHGALVLWRLRTPRLLTRTVGVTPNGEVPAGGSASLTVYGCRPGESRITMIAKELEVVTLTLNRGDVETISLRPGQVSSGTVPAPAGVDGRGVCEFGLRTTGLVGVTQWTYSPR